MYLQVKVCFQSLLNAAKDKGDAEAGGSTSLPGIFHLFTSYCSLNTNTLHKLDSCLLLYDSKLVLLLHPVMICYLVRSMFQILVSYMWIGESSNHDENPTSFVNSSTVGERNSTLKSPLRKVLSPVNTNIKLFDALVTNEPRTPKTPFPVNCMDNRFQNLGTPLEKFTACRSQVKVQLYK